MRGLASRLLATEGLPESESAENRACLTRVVRMASTSLTRPGGGIGRHAGLRSLCLTA